MTLDPHATRLGKLVANFQSLEFMLRAFLHGLPGEPPTGMPDGTDIYKLPVGTVLPENALTNYDPLKQLISKFNSEMKKRGLSEIDETLVEVRDALAHGRVSGPTTSADLRLLKFSKPTHGRVSVEFNETMSPAWFDEQVKRVYKTIITVNDNLKP